MKQWVVYKHTSPSGKTYVGITCQDPEKRWKHGSGYNRKDKHQPLFGNAIAKYGWDNIEHTIVLKGVTKSEAEYAERYLIRWYKIHNKSYNITDGGEGSLGTKHTEEAKDKIRRTRLGTKESKEATSRRIKIRIDNYSYIVLAVKGNSILSFSTAKEAAEALGIKNRCNISAAISGKQCLVNGYVFLHWNKQIPLDEDSIVSIVNEKLNKRYKKWEQKK